MAAALRGEVSRTTLYAMRDAGILEPLSRGLYRLTELDPIGNPDLVTVAARIPQGVLCLISALAFHELTTQVPHVIDVALERGSRKPRLDYPPTRFFWFSGPAFHEGITTRRLDSISVHVYDPEKTIIDCFSEARSAWTSCWRRFDFGASGARESSIRCSATHACAAWNETFAPTCKESPLRLPATLQSLARKEMPDGQKFPS